MDQWVNAPNVQRPGIGRLKIVSERRVAVGIADSAPASPTVKVASTAKIP